MMKWLLFFCLTGLAVLGVLNVSTESEVAPLKDRELKRLLKASNQESRELEKSLEMVAPQMTDTPSASADFPDSKSLGPSEVSSHFADQFRKDPEAAFEYLRGYVFEEEVSVTAREEVLDSLKNGGASGEDVRFFSREIIGSTSEPALYAKALRLHFDELPVSEKDRALREIWERAHSKELKEELRIFSKERGLPLPDQSR